MQPDFLCNGPTQMLIMLNVQRRQHASQKDKPKFGSYLC
ncbi:protein of unknown function [Acidithiobacillus ferrivorans]|uniref:Uncharacterized protein n=1 Tax=Acidithiobacillus ferrivorans TaxID=160808 RepID=A0A060URL1_9PROT|nr:hypothetical protein AFERRI_490006 [Acidithiobacillus ferrivorans]SMH66047.1 protein of unknown function [Acidithiobacillus ferrivorans]